jgi:release factor glutamine methyltransferase
MKLFDLLQDTKFKNKKVLFKLLSHYLGVGKEDLIKLYDKNLSQELVVKIEQDYFAFEKDKKPLEYILGYVKFFDKKFLVDERVLIPRPETEYMIQAIKEFGQDLKGKINILDVGTGCGVLGISAFFALSENKNLQIHQVVLSDISAGALKVAEQNINNLIPFHHRIKFKLIQSDLLENIDDDLFGLPTLLVANLPYIPDEVFENNVEENVKKREPSIAFLGGQDGLNLYKRLFNQLLEKNVSLKNITMFLEMMDWQVDRLSPLYPMIKFEKVKTFHFNIKIVKATFI